MSEEPSILDYVKALVTPWRGAPPRIPPLNSGETEVAGAAGSPPEPPDSEDLPPPNRTTVPLAAISAPAAGVRLSAAAWPWRALIALGLALLAQLSLEPSANRDWTIGALLYLLAAGWAVWSSLRGEWRLAPLPEVEPRTDPLSIHLVYLALGGIFGILAFLALGGNRFTGLNVFLWVAALIFVLWALWFPQESGIQPISRIWERLKERDWKIRLAPWTIAVLLAVGIVLFFRLYRLQSVPPEMISDHAEKLLDIWDVLNGQTSIFFPRNTGREGLQMYLTAGVIRIFGTGFSFLSMKIGTAIAGLLTLPFIYLLGKELGNRRAGLLAMLFAGTAYWPNVITRIALRFTFYPLFVAPTLYFLIRGLRRSNRNDFILAGLSLGLGLHGYTAFRIVPLVVVIAVGLYLLHRQSRGLRSRTLWYLLLLALVALIVFLPLLRFWVDNPEIFSFRAFTRLGSLERPLPGPAVFIFLGNLGRALAMFAWDNGEIWPVSIPHRPALEVVSAAFFYLGVVLLALRYLRQRYWEDIFLLLSVPLLLLPSILSLAFPNENPALNRMAGAIVPVFLIVGLSLDGFLSGLEGRLGDPLGRRMAWAFAAVLLLWSGLQNFGLVFQEYQENYRLSSWNSTEIGQVIREFTDTLVEPENAHVVAYPHWVDTRLVGLNAGFPTRDFAIAPEQLPATTSQPGAQVFIVYPEDQGAIKTLKQLYPAGDLRRYDSKVPGKNFLLFTILPPP